MKNRITTFFPSLTFSSSLFRLPLSSLFLTFLTFFLAISAQAQVPSYVPTNGLVGYWPFNGNANDESGNGNNGTVNGATLTADRFGEMDKAFSFDGSSNINVQNSFYDNGWVGNTINFWVNLSQINPSNTFFNTSPHCGFACGYSYLGNYRFYHYKGADPINNSTPCWSIFSQDLFNYNSEVINQWIMLTITKTSNNYNYYINGVLDKIADASLSPIAQQFCSMTFASVNENTENMTGSLDDIGIWNRALTADEVLSLYNGCNVASLTVSGNVTPTQFTQETYTYPNTVGSTYNWTVTNGVIVSGQGTNSIDVMWANTGIGSVSIVETNASNCTGDVVTYDVVIIPTDVEEFSTAITLFPNPATTEINLQTTTELIGSDLIIFDALGKVVLRDKILSTNQNISVNNLSNGNYIMRVGEMNNVFTISK
jgi:hypothetical protein